MKCQILFSGKNRQHSINYNNLSSAEFALSGKDYREWICLEEYTIILQREKTFADRIASLARETFLKMGLLLKADDSHEMLNLTVSEKIIIKEIRMSYATVWLNALKIKFEILQTTTIPM